MIATRVAVSLRGSDVVNTPLRLARWSMPSAPGQEDEGLAHLVPRRANGVCISYRSYAWLTLPGPGSELEFHSRSDECAIGEKGRSDRHRLLSGCVRGVVVAPE